MGSSHDASLAEGYIKMKDVLILANSSWNIVNFRTELVSSLIDEGYRVHACCPKDSSTNELQQMGVNFIGVTMARGGINPFYEVILLVRYILLFLKIRPDFVLSFTIKPNIYGGIASRILGLKCIQNITGLGSSFLKGGAMWAIMVRLYRVSTYKSYHVFFQNAADKALFEEHLIIGHKRTSVLPGSGISLERYRRKTTYGSNKEFIFLMVSRLLLDKGVYEYVEAARIMRENGYSCKFDLLGGLDSHNPSAVSPETLSNWVNSGVITYLGGEEDIVSVLEKADCVVLPSYREGAPRALMEASAMGIPLIATNVPGCNYVLDDNVTGKLVSPKSVSDLVEKMQQMVQMKVTERMAMGECGRDRMHQHFSVDKVIGAYRSKMA